MTSTLSTARPTSCALAWATPSAIFVEIPHASGIPVICRYPLSPSGLADALGALIASPEPAPRTIPRDHPAIRRPGEPAATETQRAAAREALRKAGII